MADKKQQVKCPVCGRFTTSKAVEGFKNEMNHLASALHEEQEKCKNQVKFLESKNARIEELRIELLEEREKVHKLLARKLWQRIINER